MIRSEKSLAGSEPAIGNFTGMMKLSSTRPGETRTTAAGECIERVAGHTDGNHGRQQASRRGI